MFNYRSNGFWNNSVLFHVVVSAIIWLPTAFLTVWVTTEINELGGYIVNLSLLFVFAFILLKRAKTKIRFPEIEATGEHLIINRPMHKRAVYNLKEIKTPRFYGRILYFRHLGLPVIETTSIPEDKQIELLNILSAS